MPSLAERTRAKCGELFEREFGRPWNDRWRTRLRDQHQVILNEDKKAAELGAGVRAAITNIEKFLLERRLPLSDRASWESLSYHSPRVRELYRWAYAQRELTLPKKYNKQPVQSFATFVVQRFGEAMFFDQPVLPDALLQRFRRPYSDEDCERLKAFASKIEAHKREALDKVLTQVRSGEARPYYYTFPTDRELAIVIILAGDVPESSEMVGQNAKLTSPARVLEIASNNMKKVRMRLFRRPIPPSSEQPMTTAESEPISSKEINDALFFKPAGSITGRIPHERFLSIPATDD